NQIDRFVCRNHSNGAWKHAAHTCLRAIPNRAWRRRLRKQATIAWSAEKRRKYSRLTVEAKNRSVNVWLLRENTHVVRQIAGWKIIRAVDNHVVIRDNLECILTREPAFVCFDLDVWVRVAQ